MGAPALDYDSFKIAFDSDPSFKNLIDKIDDNGVTLKTKNNPQAVGDLGDKATAQANVLMTAKKAASKLLGK